MSMPGERYSLGRRALLPVILLLAGCATGMDEEGGCAPEPALIGTLSGGAEDIVALPLGNGITRLFVREACGGSGCVPGSNRIGTVDIGPAAASPRHTEPAWQPAGHPDFHPFGMSLLRGARVGDGELLVLDRKPSVLGKDERAPRIWRIPIKAGKLGSLSGQADSPWYEGHSISDGNDLQAVRDTAYVTRYDFLGFLPWRGKGWHGVVQVRQGQGDERSSPVPVVEADGLRGANGIVDPGPEHADLIVADYWGRRLRFVAKNPDAGRQIRYATGLLPIHPDNLTLDGDRLLIAGQRWFPLAAINLWLPAFPSPSRVLDVKVSSLGPDAGPEPGQGMRRLWAGGLSHGRSVSVAVPVPADGLALGQIRTPGVLHVRCSGGGS